MRQSSIRSKWSSVLPSLALVVGGLAAGAAQAVPICTATRTSRIQCDPWNGPGRFDLVCEGLKLECTGQPPVQVFEVCRFPQSGNEETTVDLACNSESAVPDTRPTLAQCIDVGSLPVASEIPESKEGVFPYRFPFEESVEKLAHRHKNGGGIVSEDSRVDDSAYIGEGATVSSSEIGSETIVLGGAVVSHAAVAPRSLVGGVVVLWKTEATLQCDAAQIQSEDVKHVDGKETLSIAVRCAR
jgi:hypothetical protein